MYAILTISAGPEYAMNFLRNPVKCDNFEYNPEVVTIAPWHDLHIKVSYG